MILCVLNHKKLILTATTTKKNMYQVFCNVFCHLCVLYHGGHVRTRLLGDVGEKVRQLDSLMAAASINYHTKCFFFLKIKKKTVEKVVLTL